MDTILPNSLSSWLPLPSLSWLQVTLVAVVLLLLVLIEYRNSFQEYKGRNVKNLPEAPSPLRLPLIGHIYKLATYPDNPWEGFNAIRKQFGDVVRLRLGIYPTVMVSSAEAMREVLLIKGELFGDRPQFYRHALIFGRNVQNALALCDWTESHKVRRSIAHAAVIPRFGSDCFRRLSSCIDGNVERLLDQIRLPTQAQCQLDKQQINLLCVEIFIEFLLEKRVDIDDPVVKDVAKRYDFIFYDINQMYLSDFIPSFSVFARKYLNFVENNATTLKNFIADNVMPRLEHLIEERKEKKGDNETSTKPGETVDKDKAEADTKYDDRFVDQILLNKQYNSKARFLDFVLNHYLDNPKDMTWEECLYEIGDLVGGNSAVSNLMMRMLGWLALNPEVQENIHQEVVSSTNISAAERKAGTARILLEERTHMPLLNAAIMETLRLASSPIVPHLARQDTSVQGYFIPKNTMILFNIYHMNLSPDLWHEPRRFNPARFVTDCGNIVKPDYFIPFSHGRRSCLGYKMVNSVIFATVANILLYYKITVGDKDNQKLMTSLLEPKGTIALPYHEGECYNLRLEAREL